MPITTIHYVCPVCGYAWDDAITDSMTVATCQCPNCEEQVEGVV